MQFQTTSTAIPIIAGVDEAGRGPLAGPVVAATVVLCPQGIDGLDDSKRLTARKRAALDVIIRAQCAWGIGVSDQDEIDQINILQATFKAMSRAVLALEQQFGTEPDHILTDGNRIPPVHSGWRWPAEAIVGGDATQPCISAASIIAKQHRDGLMRAAALQYPGYGWERNMGYGTAEHLAALRKLGPTPLHRRSFAPVSQLALL